MDCRTLTKVPGRLQMVCPVQKCVSETSLHFQLELNALAFLCPHRQKSKELSSSEPGGCLEIKFSLTYTDINFFFIVWRGKFTPEIFPSNLDTTCIGKSIKSFTWLHWLFSVSFTSENESRQKPTKMLYFLHVFLLIPGNSFVEASSLNGQLQAVLRVHVPWSKTCFYKMPYSITAYELRTIIGIQRVSPGLRHYVNCFSREPSVLSASWLEVF